MTMYAQQNASPAFCGEVSSAAHQCAVLVILVGIALAVSIFVSLDRISCLLLLPLAVLLAYNSWCPPVREAKKQ